MEKNRDYDRRIRRIVALAEPLEDRCSSLDKYQLFEESWDPEAIEHWRDRAALGDQQRFLDRLSLDGVDESLAKAALKVHSLRPGQPLPSWAVTLTKVVQSAREVACGNTEIANIPQRLLKLPFRPFLDVFMHVGKNLLKTKEKDYRKYLSKQAAWTLDRQLLQRLHSILSLPLSETFFQFRSAIQSQVVQVADSQGGKSDTVYNLFIKNLLGSMLRFFEVYPVAARLAVFELEMWVENYLLLMRRLDNDRELLRKVMGVDLTQDCIEDINVGISDHHNGGKSVVILKFKDDFKIVYKPRSLGIDEAYNEFLQWLNDNGTPFPFRCIKSIDRGEYGWTEFIEHRPCASVEEVNQFYATSGALLCVLSILGANDAHKENVIANGKNPVFVDAETLLQPSVKIKGERSSIMHIAAEKLRNSVIRVGLLPSWNVIYKNEERNIARDISGLGGIDEGESTFLTPYWDNVNTDKMVLTYRPIGWARDKNVLIYDGRVLDPSSYGDQIVDGFTQTYRYLMQVRSELLSSDGPIMGFKGKKTRVIVRNTRIYTKLLREAVRPDLLENGSRRSIYMDMLSQPFTNENSTPREVASQYWPILRSEKLALDLNDIPYFTAKTDQTSVFLSNGDEVCGYHTTSGFADLISSLNSLGEEELSRNQDYIKGSLLSRGNVIHYITQRHSSEAAEYNVESGAQIDREIAYEVIGEIANEIIDRAIRSEDGEEVAWICPRYSSSLQRYRFGVTGFDLYEGNSGIALFLAAYANIVQAEEAGYVARGAFHPIRRLLERDDGGVEGGEGHIGPIGGMIYALVKASELLRDDSLVSDALRLSNVLTEERVRTDTDFDILAGTAGALLGLRVLFDKTRSTEVLESMVTCGDHILQNMRSNDEESGPRAWSTLNGEFNSGFAHGATGICYALSRLFEITGDPKLLEAVREGLDYEDSLFLPEFNNWRDLRDLGESHVVAWGWCHGSPGITLGRFGMWHLFRQDYLGEHLKDILQGIATRNRLGPDDLCCGRMGRTETLLTANSILGATEWRDAATWSVNEILQNAKKKEGFDFDYRLSQGVFCPGLFKGIAGIGYQLLRSLYPSKVPSLLLWQ